MNIFFLPVPTSRKVLPTFQTFCPVGPPPCTVGVQIAISVQEFRFFRKWYSV